MVFGIKTIPKMSLLTFMGILFILPNSQAGFSLFKKSPLNMTTCLANLEMIPTKVEDRISPHNSLFDFRAFLRGHGGIHPNAAQANYSSISIQNEDLTKKKLKNKKLKKYLGRLSALTNDVLKLRSDRISIGYEVRGWEDIDRLIPEIEARIAITEDHIKEHRLNSLHPLRFQRVVDIFFASMTSSLFMATNYSHINLNELVGLTLAAIGGGGYFLTRLYQKDFIADAKFNSHLELIKKASRKKHRKHKAYPLSVYGIDFLSTVDLHNEMLKIAGEKTKVDQDLINLEGERHHRFIFDIFPGVYKKTIKQYGSLRNYLLIMQKNYPEGFYRKVYIDQIFYTDPITAEPVWIFYYRSFKDTPTTPKKPKDDDLTEQGPKSKLIPGLIPIQNQ